MRSKNALAEPPPTRRPDSIIAVRTTGIYCRPGCPARAPKPENVTHYDTVEAARAAGYRACKRCRPDGDAVSIEDAVARACAALDAEEAPDLDALAEAAGFSASHFHRRFRALVGVTPKAYAEARRTARAAAALSGAARVTDAIYEGGYSGPGRFYEAVGPRLGMAASAYRKGGAGEAIAFAVAPSSLGLVLVAATARGVCAIQFGDAPDAMEADLRRRFPKATLTPGEGAFAETVAAVVALIETPKAGLSLPLDVQGTAFQERVWRALRAIPAGTTASYADIAAAIGQPRAVRAVARACADNRIAVAVPCHRVVRSDGALSGYRWGPERKRALLAREKAPSKS